MGRQSLVKRDRLQTRLVVRAAFDAGCPPGVEPGLPDPQPGVITVIPWAPWWNSQKRGSAQQHTELY